MAPPGLPDAPAGPSQRMLSVASITRAGYRSGGMGGEIDPGGTRKAGLDAFLEEKVAEGFAVETRTETHAILFRRPRGIRWFRSADDPGRFVVEVDENGNATMRPAEPRRS
jgi:hypothetical protein